MTTHTITPPSCPTTAPQSERERLRGIDCEVERVRGRSIHPDGVVLKQWEGQEPTYYWQDKYLRWQRVPFYTTSDLDSMYLVRKMAGMRGRFDVSFQRGMKPGEAIARAYIAAVEAETAE